MTPLLRPAALLVCAAFVAGCLGATTPPAAAFESRAPTVHVIDHATGTVLMSRNADVPLPPASMSKLMTLNMLFEALQDGRVSEETTFRTSARAAAMGGSRLFVREGERVAVRDLMIGLIVQSGNDASVVVAEGLGGTEEAFSRQMTERAHALGWSTANFTNASGWPEPGHRISSRDLVALAQRLISDFPEYYVHFARDRFEFDGRVPANMYNRNPILNLWRPEDGIRADGLKTGFTSEAGFGLVGSAVAIDDGEPQPDRRVIFVISGLESEAARAEEAERIVNWYFRQFSRRTVARQGAEYARAPVWLGSADSVALTVPEDVVALVPALARDTLDAEVHFISPIEAPVRSGQVAGEMIVSLPDLPDLRVPLVAAADVERGGVVTRLRTAADVLIGRGFGGE